MKARQFVNVVMRRYGMYSVGRIKPEEQLFYPSTKEAQAAAPSNKELETSISRMPAPKLKLERPAVMDNRMDFLPFYERGCGGYSKILCIDEEGRTVLYDTDAGLLHSVPGLNGPKGAKPISFSIIDRNPRDPGRADALYVMGRYPRRYDYFNFEALMYSEPSNSWKDWRWHRLPPPPAHVDTSMVSCHALIDEPGHDPILMVSSTEESRVGTYCFNTCTNLWSKAGDWTLPFVGRVEHVPELDNLWFGIAIKWPYDLCAMDLSVEVPLLAYNWEDLALPEDWEMTDCSMVYLGDGKFCIAKIFEFYMDNDQTEMGAVISGLEVLRHGEPSSKLVMVKHKSKLYKFTRNQIHCIL
uniref:Uncharacterized protein n=1 Tax=Avena sativa TaxID=4498 RepID=A0ACD5Y9Q6_AVESA